jgi:isopentenyl-diphosphate delta-isomerase
METANNVVLVDKSGRELVNSDGTRLTMDKLKAHKKGLLHRAVSVFVFNTRDELLLQKRASGKYHSADKWTNTCCTHPRPGETPAATARRRLHEEMGLECPLTEAFNFLYQANVGNGLVENEFDHVFIGFCDRDPQPDPAEVSDWKWISAEELGQELKNNPEHYTAWLRVCFERVIESLQKLRKNPS